MRATTGALALAMISGLAASTVPLIAQADVPAVVVNEVESNGDATDWIEFKNVGDIAVDLSGYIVKDNDDTRTLAIPAGTVVEPGGYFVVDTDADDTVGFGLGKGDSARLFLPDGTTLVDGYTWPNNHAPVTYGRCPDGTGEFVDTVTSTKGAANDCAVPAGEIVINEVESQGGSPDDWIELLNVGDAPIDISGYVVTDNSPEDPTHRHTIPAGTVVGAGEYFVIDVGGDVFGLGGADSAMLFAADGTTVVDSTSWTAHSATSIGRCPNGTGGFRDTSEPTKGAANLCPAAEIATVVINETNSNTGTDFIEIMNVGTEPADISGYILKDNDDTRTDAIPAGTVVAPGGFYVAYTDNQFSFGLGKADMARLFLPDGVTLVDSHSWSDHIVPSSGRCPDGTGAFITTGATTPGAANNCGEDTGVANWPGSPDTTVIDTEAMFIEDSSGLDFAMEGDQGVLWAVDNGTGTFWKLNASADGSVTFADGKRARFIKDAANPAAAGPDAEGITAAGDGFIYIAAERDNTDKGINYNVVLKVDPNTAGRDVVATQEWNLTASLPQVTANTGIEAIEWVADTELAGKLWDATTNAPYNPADHPLHGDGLFFVAVEDNGGVYAYALNSDGTSTQVAYLDPQLGGVMALDWDAELGLLWALCDDGCAGTGAQILLDGSESAFVTHVARPANLPNTNNEGFATSTLCEAGERPVWWFTDGVRPGALRSGSLPCGDAPVDPMPVDPKPVDPTPVTPKPGNGGTKPKPGLPSTGR